jgi:hypothetical protein
VQPEVYRRCLHVIFRGIAPATRTNLAAFDAGSEADPTLPSCFFQLELGLERTPNTENLLRPLVPYSFSQIDSCGAETRAGRRHQRDVAGVKTR